MDTGRTQETCNWRAGDAPHTEGVAFLLCREAQQALIGWEARGPRLITASFSTVHRKQKMTNNINEKKTQFYNQVQSILSELNSKYI